MARNVDVMRGWIDKPAAGHSRRVHLHFFARPHEIRGGDHAETVVVERTRLTSEGGAEGTGEFFDVPANVVVRSVGYRGTALDEVPFDSSKNVIPHNDGRVHRDGVTVPGEYVAGWIKRGPTGIIGTNKKDATATVASLLADAADGKLAEPATPSAEAFDALLAARGVVTVSTAGWRSINDAERALGASRGRDRTTIHHQDDLLKAAEGVV